MTIKVRVRVSENNEGTLEEFMILTVIGNDMPDIVNQCKQATDYIKTRFAERPDVSYEIL